MNIGVDEDNLWDSERIEIYSFLDEIEKEIDIEIYAIRNGEDCNRRWDNPKDLSEIDGNIRV